MAIKDGVHFGISTDAGGFDATESISITHRADKAEVIGETGNIFGCNYYNHTGEWTCTGYKGSYTAPTIGSNITTLGADGNGNLAPGFTGAGGATGGEATGALVWVTEVTVEESNEDFQKYTIKGNFYDSITT